VHEGKLLHLVNGQWSMVNGQSAIRLRQGFGKGQRAKGKGQKAKGKRQKAKGKRQKAKGKRQKAKGKRQKAKNFGRRKVVINLKTRELFHVSRFTFHDKTYLRVGVFKEFWPDND
jgi:hypothetical protein